MSAAPFPWYGGKQYLAPALVDLLPPHEVYVEVFGGAASLLFSKAPSRLEVYNDLDSGLVNFFRVLRDAAKVHELQRLLDLTPYAREEWRECVKTWLDAPSDVEMARRWFMTLVGSFGKHVGASAGWSFIKAPHASKTHSFRTTTDALSGFTQRLRYVQVEHGDFERVLALYDSPSALFYVDPPYMAETRNGSKRYVHEMTDGDHERLLRALFRARGMVMLSGYSSPLYTEMLPGWRRVDIATIAHAANVAKRTRAKRTECIWLSPNATQHQPELWSTAAAAEEVSA